MHGWMDVGAESLKGGVRGMIGNGDFFKLFFGSSGSSSSVCLKVSRPKPIDKKFIIIKKWT
jgi:hypothetical protein